ncbi:hypothetical protein C1645_840942 [Glomus cerebriforme]|uniref:Uncharacterized protein n=1 Tax=Glomus cerebriforme TaxID=658196 RepID=A0A397S3N9_9GLOM|nr:hypothetical protein C1645_840942 [Glomus cerebriforme]
MEQIIKKKPSSKTTMQMIFIQFDEYNSSIHPVFKNLLPYSKQEKIYIYIASVN